MNNKKISRLHISLLAIFACIIWATAFPFVKLGLKYFNPLFFAGSRFILSALLLFPFCGGIKKCTKVVSENFPMISQIAFFQIFLLYATFFIGLSLVPASVAAIVIGSSPLITAMVAHILIKNEPLSAPKMVNISMGIIGVIILTLSRQPWTHTGFREFLGIVILLIGSIVSAIGNILVSKSKASINPISLNAWQIGLGGIGLLIISFIFEGIPQLPVDINAYMILLWLAIVSASAFSIWFYLLKIPGVKVSELNIWKFLLPVFGAGLSWMIIVNDKPTFGTMLGIWIIVTTLIRHYRDELKKNY